MPCEHLKELFDLCQKHDLHIAGRDAVKVVCRQCEQQEVCPSSLTDGDQVLTEISYPAKKSSTEPKTVSGDS